jgi:hypothetical protein
MKTSIKQAVKDPEWTDTHEYDRFTWFTDKMTALVEKAAKLIEPYVKKNVPDNICYFNVYGEDTGETYCDSDKCVEPVRKKLIEMYGEENVELCYNYNNGDHKMIKYCASCLVELNDDLTWCEDDLEEILYSANPDDIEGLKAEAFRIHAILSSQPTSDQRLNDWNNYSRNKPDPQDVKRREEFFQQVAMLADIVVKAFEPKQDKELKNE